MYNYINMSKDFTEKMESKGYEIIVGQKSFKYTYYNEFTTALMKLFFVKNNEILDKSVADEIKNYISTELTFVPEYKRSMVLKEIERWIQHFLLYDVDDIKTMDRMKELIRNSEDDNFGFLRWIKHSNKKE